MREREIEGEQVAYYVRNQQTKQDEMRWRPRIQVVACGCIMRAGLPTGDACGLGGLEHMTCDEFDAADLLADGQAVAWAEVLAWATGLPRSAQLGGERWRGFVFHGRHGTGKTHLAAALALRALAQGIRPRFLAERQFYGRFSAAYANGEGDEGVVLALASAALLVIDDVGKGYTRPGAGSADEEATWRAALLEQVLDARLRSRKPTILTTNVPVMDWPRRFGNALADRLSLLTAVYFGGESRR